MTILLSTETGGGSNDTSVINIAGSNGYDFAGLDSNANRTNTRDGLEYYRGIPITSWPIGDRRRLAVMNVLAGSPSHQQYEILYNMEIPNTSAAKAAIDAVENAPAGTSFDAWKTANSLPTGQEGPGDDPDHDGAVNLLEFHAGTHPLDGASRPVSMLMQTPTGFSYTYRRAKDRIGITHTLQSGPLNDLAAFTPANETTMDLPDDIEEVTVPLPPGFGPFIRQSVTLDP